MHRGQQSAEATSLSGYADEYQAVQDLSDDEFVALFDTRVVVAGSRGFNDYAAFVEHLEYHIDLPLLLARDACFISGVARRGSDAMIVRYCKERQILCREYPADWDALGKRAGYVRNSAMAKVSTDAFIFWDTVSKGTAHMLAECTRLLPERVITFAVDSEDTQPSSTQSQQGVRNQSAYALANQKMLSWEPDTD